MLGDDRSYGGGDDSRVVKGMGKEGVWKLKKKKRLFTY